MAENYDQITIKEEIIKKLNSIDRTRRNRINLSERLKKYYQRWKFIFFILNFEAVFLIIWALQEDSNNHNYSFLSGFFSIYVILLQYFINEQNYNERSLKSHYHQLELKDTYLQMKTLLISLNLDSEKREDERILDKDKIAMYEIIMNNYQMMLKNNENHSQKDDTIRKLSRETIKLKKLDFSLDNILISMNYLIGIGIIVVIMNIIF